MGPTTTHGEDRPAPPPSSKLLSATPYEAYVYGYPHKTAYRPLAPAIRLDEVWSDESKDALFLYMHVPFCEMRCGFCNLFTTPRPPEDLVAAFLYALERQAWRVRELLPDASFARFAIGGGTPTLLAAADLERLLDVASETMGADLPGIPISIETSPETACPEKLMLLRARGVDRVSIGVQSFIDAEAAQVNRPQSRAEVEVALDRIRRCGFPTLNIDLIYGLPGQTVQSWLESLQAALAWQPEELYLYPLYVRPLTTIGKRGRPWDDQRVTLYRFACEVLEEAGYTQSSMRMFRAGHASADHGPVYCVQNDGMIGLGCGARSYTQRLHYASEYAVGARGVKDILRRWVERDDNQLGIADYGFVLDDDEQRRRFASLSLLAEGLDREVYRQRFGSEVLDDLPQLAQLSGLGLCTIDESGLRLTRPGLERSDAIGPWLFSDEVRHLMRDYELR